MSLALSLGAVETGALENNVNAQLTPGKLSSVGLRVDGDFLAVYDDGAFACLYGVQVLADGAAVALLSGVILEQVSEHLGIGKVVDGNDLVTGSVKHLSERQTTNAAKAVDCNFYGHNKIPPKIRYLYYITFFLFIQ